MTDALLSRERRRFHAKLLGKILTVNTAGVPSNADTGSKPSIAIASSIVEQLGHAASNEKLPGQTAGADFEEHCADFVRACFARVGHLRPGNFTVLKGGGIAQFDQYAHLEALDTIARANREIATAMGADYLIKPDILIAREPVEDASINASQRLVDESTARLTSLRKANQPLPTLHASISCKWTLRSDRAQNARSEGLNLVRNRKGRLPHIAVITAEPMPGRVASLALGTGDIDCVYHFALYELRRALMAQERDEALDFLDTMIEGKRLRDISDLPLDLAV